MTVDDSLSLFIYLSFYLNKRRELSVSCRVGNSFNFHFYRFIHTFDLRSSRLFFSISSFLFIFINLFVIFFVLCRVTLMPLYVVNYCGFYITFTCSKLTTYFWISGHNEWKGSLCFSSSMKISHK